MQLVEKWNQIKLYTANRWTNEMIKKYIDNK